MVCLACGGFPCRACLEDLALLGRGRVFAYPSPYPSHYARAWARVRLEEGQVVGVREVDPGLLLAHNLPEENLEREREKEGGRAGEGREGEGERGGGEGEGG